MPQAHTIQHRHELGVCEMTPHNGRRVEVVPDRPLELQNIVRDCGDARAQKLTRYRFNLPSINGDGSRMLNNVEQCKDDRRLATKAGSLTLAQGFFHRLVKQAGQGRKVYPLTVYSAHKGQLSRGAQSVVLFSLDCERTKTHRCMDPC